MRGGSTGNAAGRPERAPGEGATSTARVRRRGIAVVLAALAVAASAAAAPADTPAPQPAPEHAAPGVQWGTCPPHTTAGERCGRVTVPLDHDHPGDRTLQIGVSRSPATGSAAERQGVLLINFGGPGAGAVGSAAAFARLLPDPVRRAYDVVGFDPRGRATSTHIDCLDLATFARAPKPDTALTTAAGQQAIVDAARVYSDGCKAKAPDLLPYLTTRQIADDMDAIRTAFGEDKINYLGYSYGTYLGAVYGQRHPDRVRRMILDSIVDPTQVWYGTGAGQAHAFWLRWRDWADWTARHDAAYGLGTTRDAVLAAWNRAREALAAHPAEGTLGGTEFDTLTIGGLYSDRQWPALAQAVSAYAQRSDAGPLRDLKGTVTADDENFDSVFQTVTCADAPAPADPAVFARDTEDLGRKYGYLGANIASAGACLSLQSNTLPPTVIDGKGLPPVLLIQGTRDPATPYTGAAHMRAALPSARMLTVQGSGNHGQFIGGGPCVDDAGSAYLVRGTLADDASCPALPEPDPGTRAPRGAVPPVR